MKLIYRIKLEAFNFSEVSHTCYSHDFENHPSEEELKKFYDAYRDKFGKVRCEIQVLKVYI
jgi:hypothetical protein